MLSRLSAALVVLAPFLLAACLVGAMDGDQDHDEIGERLEPPAESPAKPELAPGGGDGYQSPCITGEYVLVNGEWIHVPVPCRRGPWIDMGDPPPYEVEPAMPHVLPEQ